MTVPPLSPETLERLRAQHEKNIDLLLEMVKQHQQHDRYLRWFGWLPGHHLEREMKAELAEGIVTLGHVDRELVSLIQLCEQEES